MFVFSRLPKQFWPLPARRGNEKAQHSQIASRMRPCRAGFALNALSIAASFTVMNPMLLVDIKVAPGVVVADFKVEAG